MAITINPIKPESDHDSQDSPKILNFETVASYNWLDEPKPTILVPGIPPIWDPPQMSPVLSPDTGGRSVDQDADRTPGSPLQALIHAVQICQSGFDFTHVSIVTDRKSLRCLLGFVRAEPVAFEFGISIVGDTALFTRMEKETRYHPLGDYRNAFEEQYTKIPASAACSTSHHRVVKYDFAGETILLRYAVDAYLGEVAKPLMWGDGIEDTDLGPLVQPLKNMDFKGDPPSKALPTNTPVTVVAGGRHIPHRATLELTTRAEDSRAPDSIESKMPDFWISQTLKYLLCLHREKRDEFSRSTIFNCTRLVPLRDLLLGWEEDNAEKLRALAHVLRQLIEAAKELGGSCVVSLGRSERPLLNVSRAEGKEVPALPEDMQSLFVPIKNEAVDVPKKMEEAAISGSSASQDLTRKRKYHTEDAPESTGSPSAKKPALNPSVRTHGEVTVPTKDEKLALAASTSPYIATRKRKLDAEDAPELIDSPLARRRALKSPFNTPTHGDTPCMEETPSVKMNDEPLDSENGV